MNIKIQKAGLERAHSQTDFNMNLKKANGERELLDAPFTYISPNNVVPVRETNK